MLFTGIDIVEKKILVQIFCTNKFNRFAEGSVVPPHPI